jgi:hypothetical protein
MLMFTGKVAEEIEKYEREKKEFVGESKPSTLTDEQLFDLYKVIDMMKTIPIMINIFQTIGANIALRSILGKESLIKYVTDLERISIKS